MRQSDPMHPMHLPLYRYVFFNMFIIVLNTLEGAFVHQLCAGDDPCMAARVTDLLCCISFAILFLIGQVRGMCIDRAIACSPLSVYPSAPAPAPAPIARLVLARSLSD